MEFNQGRASEAERKGAIVSHDTRPYSAEERAGAIPQPESQLNNGGGQPFVSPSMAPEGSFPMPDLTTALRVDTGLSGVDEIADFTDFGRGGR